MVSKAHPASLECRDMYDALSPLWLCVFGDNIHAGLNHHTPGDRSRRSLAQAQQHLVEEVLRKAGIDGKSGIREAVDLGCGFGATTIWLAGTLGCEVLGVNISAVQLQHARRLAAEAGLGQRVTWQVGDVIQEPRDSEGRFDLVWSLETCCHMPDVRAYVNRMAELAAPGGHIVMSDVFREAGDLQPKQQRLIAKLADAFSTSGLASSAEAAAALGEAGLVDIVVEDWTDLVIGFWDASLLDLLARYDHHQHPGHGSCEARDVKRKALRHSWQVTKRLVAAGTLVVAGGKSTLKAAVDRSVVRKAFQAGAARYAVITARKPVT